MRKFIFIVLFVIPSNLTTYAQRRWALELHGGTAYNVPMPLTIKQEGFHDIKLWAQFYTEPFTPPVYWDCRIARWDNGKSWEFEVIHHKLYLRNKPTDVQKFSISHGFNIVNINRGFELPQHTFRYGLGLVFTHPESRIRGLEYGDSADPWDLGYFISGPIANVAVSKPLHFNRRFYLNIEGKTSLAYTYINIANGHSNVWNFALHLVFGFGTNFIIRDKE